MSQRSVLLVTIDYPPRLGGVASYLSHLVDCFPRGAVQVLAPKEGDTHDLDVRSEAPIYRRQMSSRWLRPRWLPALYWTDWLCRKERPTRLLVSHLLPMGVIARMMKKRRGIPYAVILHGMDLALALDAGGRKLETAKRVLADAEIVAANSAFTAGLAESVGVSGSKITVVRPSPSFPPYTTVPPEKAAEIRKRYGLGDDPVVLSLGRLVPRKGFATSIEAVSLLKEKGMFVRLLVAGDGPERKRLEKLAKDKGIDDRVAFSGPVKQEELQSFFAACDIFAMTPKSIGADVEGFGIVYLEANLMGKPAIGSRAGGVPEAVLDGRTGLLVDPGDASALAAAIGRLAADPALRERLGAEGRRRVIEEFGWRDQCRPLVNALLV